MAKVVMTADTDTGVLEVTAGGKKVDNVTGVSAECYQYFDYDKQMMVPRAYVNVMTAERDESGMHKMTRMSAAEEGETVKKAVAAYLGE